MNKDLKIILHALFVLALHVASVNCLIMSLISKDTYVLALAIFFYVMAFKHESEDKDV
jgi:hypothetical protein